MLCFCAAPAGSCLTRNFLASLSFLAGEGDEVGEWEEELLGCVLDGEATTEQFCGLPPGEAVSALGRPGVGADFRLLGVTCGEATCARMVLNDGLTPLFRLIVCGADF